MNQSLFALFALALVLVGCDLDDQEADLPLTPKPEQHYAPPPEPNSLSLTTPLDHANGAAFVGPPSLNGVYQGVLPCANCAGIDTTLALNANNSYIIQKIYIGSDKNAEIRSGTVSWSQDGDILELSGENEPVRQFRVHHQNLTLVAVSTDTASIGQPIYHLVQLP